MEEGWERTPQLELGPDDLKRLVAPAFPGRQIEEKNLLTTGLANTNVKFRLAGDTGAYVLRVHTREPEAALRELELMRYLTADPASGVPVAPLVYSSAGGEESALAYSIWGFVDGTLLQQLMKELKPSELVGIAAECGRVLARVAAHPFDRCGVFGPKLAVVREYARPSELVPSMVYQGLYAGRAGGRLGQALRDELWRVVERAAPALRAIDGRYALVHGDYKRSNILMQRSGAGWKVGAVLDWEFAFAGSPIVDVGLFLRAGEALPDGFREAFTSAYAAGGGELPTDWLPLSRLIDLVSQVIFLNGPSDRPNVFAETVTVIQETIRVLA